ncbi:MAG: hypothetical protein WDM79_01690 [Terricaulis sp.]
MRAARGARFDALSQTTQHLDLWTGALSSAFVFDGQPVAVETRVHPTRDIVLVEITSPLVASGRLGVQVRYPGVSASLNPNPADFGNDAAHSTEIVRTGAGRMVLRRQLDDTVYFSSILAPGARIGEAGPHRFEIVAQRGERLVVMVSFERDEAAARRSQSYRSGVQASAESWRNYWTHGGMIDFSGSTDPRAAELERRVVLSQYLSAINGAGDVPPQEEGLFSNSWNGKFHLEVHPLHAAHFAAWGRPAFLENSLAWYLEELPRAQEEARRHGVEGAWWPKMTGPEGRNSPSTINPFIMWQQPHPIYMAELVYRAEPNAATLARYGAMVEETAKLLATWPLWDEAGQRYVLGPPVIPVQENHPPLTTINPTFEVEYYRWGLQTAQAWRERRGLAREPSWDRVIARMAPVAERDGLYLPVESEPDFWRNAQSSACSKHAIEPQCLNRDHPSFLLAYGLIAGDRINPETMRTTLRAVESDWDLRQTWGWDFPTIAMSAARLGEPEEALDWLFMDLRNNQWGVSGMTPRVHIEAHADQLVLNATQGPDGPGYRRAAETYFPSNGSLLLAVGMMAAGWDGSSGHAPGFPREGWNVRVEDIAPLP